MVHLINLKKSNCWVLRKSYKNVIFLKYLILNVSRKFSINCFRNMIITSIHLKVFMSAILWQIHDAPCLINEGKNITRSDQIIISWEKQNTPNLPPFKVPSNTFPESATILSPSNILNKDYIKLLRIKEMSFATNFYCFPFILATRCCRPLIFQTMNSVRSNSLS